LFTDHENTLLIHKFYDKKRVTGGKSKKKKMAQGKHRFQLSSKNKIKKKSRCPSRKFSSKKIFFGTKYITLPWAQVGY